MVKKMSKLFVYIAVTVQMTYIHYYIWKRWTWKGCMCYWTKKQIEPFHIHSLCLVGTLLLCTVQYWYCILYNTLIKYDTKLWRFCCNFLSNPSVCLLSIFIIKGALMFITTFWIITQSVTNTVHNVRYVCDNRFAVTSNNIFYPNCLENDIKVPKST